MTKKLNFGPSKLTVDNICEYVYLDEAARLVKMSTKNFFILFIKNAHIPFTQLNWFDKDAYKTWDEVLKGNGFIKGKKQKRGMTPIMINKNDLYPYIKKSKRISPYVKKI